MAGGVLVAISAKSAIHEILGAVSFGLGAVCFGVSILIGKIDDLTAIAKASQAK
ncbi:hypothetical protein ABUK73_15950 [Agrobacterium sp. BA1120]|uniref:hypothetical protein n=1 Tax=Agrobacterium sp. BA1120 TaxID=3228927 RepID=UPI003369D509